MTKQELEKNKWLMQDFEDFWLDEIIDEEIQDKQLDETTRKDIQKQDINKFWKELWKSTFIESPKSVLKKEKNIKTHIPVDKKVFSKENKIQKINKENNKENNTVINNKEVIIQDKWEVIIQDKWWTWNTTIVNENTNIHWWIVNSEVLSWKNKEWNFIKETIKENNKQDVSDININIWWNTWWTIEKVYQEKIQENTIWDWKIIEENIKIEWWSKVDLDPRLATKKETVDHKNLFTQEETFQQLEENKKIEKKINLEWNNIVWEEQVIDWWKQEKIIEKEQIKEVQTVLEKQNEKETQQIPNSTEKDQTVVNKPKIQILWTNNLWDVDFEEEIKKEWNKLWKKEKVFEKEELENISRTLKKDSKFVSVIQWIDKWIIKWKLSNDIREEFNKETEWQMFWTYEKTKEIFENEQLKNQWKFDAKLVWLDKVKESAEYQYFQQIRDLLSYLNYSLSQTTVKTFTVWYMLLVVVYTVLWIVSVKWWFTISWLWWWLWWLLFWWILIVILSQFVYKWNWKWWENNES